MVTSAYDIGDLRRLQVDFTNIAGAAADPTEVILTVRAPDGTLTTKKKSLSELTNSQVGRYTFDFTIAQTGRHIVRWEGTGTLVTAEEQEFYAKRKEAQ